MELFSLGQKGNPPGRRIFNYCRRRAGHDEVWGGSRRCPLWGANISIGFTAVFVARGSLQDPGHCIVLPSLSLFAFGFMLSLVVLPDHSLTHCTARGAGGSGVCDTVS